MDDKEYMNYLFEKRDEAMGTLFSNLFQASVAFVALAVPLLSAMGKTGCRFWLCGIGCVCALISACLSGVLIWYNMHRYRVAIPKYAECAIEGLEYEGTNEPCCIKLFRKIVWVPLTIAVILFVVGVLISGAK